MKHKLELAGPNTYHGGLHRYGYYMQNTDFESWLFVDHYYGSSISNVQRSIIEHRAGDMLEWDD